MGVSTYTHEVAGTVDPARMFKAVFVDAHNLLPKVMPQFIKSIDIVHGDGGAGTIRQMNYIEGENVKYLKHKFDIMDGENLVSKYWLIEGDVMGDKVEKVYYEVKFEADGKGGCICKTIIKYHTKGDHVLKEEENKEANDKAVGMFKAVEQYLHANPTVYA